MFGHKDDDMGNTEDQQDNGGFVSTPHPEPSSPPEPPTTDTPTPDPISVAPSSDSSSDSSDSSDSTPQFGQPFNPGSVLPGTEDSPKPSPEPASSEPSSSEDSTEPSTPIANDELIDIKKEALQQLTPLVGHLDQTPEEKFKTTMMMIQAADDQSLIQRAYDAAQQITDDTAKAQALLDIVNEINYFTQHDK